MRVGLVCPYNIGLGGGVQECVLAMQRELSRRGHNVRVITPRSKEAQKIDNKNIILVGAGTDVKSPFATTAQLSASTNTEELQQIIDEYEFDIMHFHEPWVPMLSGQLLAKSRSVNLATFHAHIPDSVMTKVIERVITPYTKSILRSFDALTAVSEPAAEYARSLTSQPIHIIPNGIDTAKYRPGRVEKRANKIILHIGRLEKRKGVKYLIDAFARLDDSHSELIIAGDGPDRRKLESRAISLGLSNVKFLGFVSENKKIQLLREASVFSSAAIYGESFGIVLLEAMACGTPVVAANNPGYVWVMRDRGMISLVNPKDTEQYARRLALMLSDDELAGLWRDWAVGYASKFDYTKIVDQYEQLYEQRLTKQK